MKEKKALPAALEGRCPRCRSGKVFKHPLYKLTKFTETHERCPVCDWQFERQPGFWYGAMYFSYAFSVGILLTTTFVLYYAFNDPPLPIYLIAVTGISAITYPVNFRYSRLIFLYLFSGTKYDARWAAGEKS